MRTSLRRILDDAALTLAVECSLLIAFFLFFRMLASHADVAQVSIYALLRRVLAVVLPFALLGLTDGLAKYLPQAATLRDRTRFLLAAAVAVFAASAVLSFVAARNPAATARIALGEGALAPLVLPCLVFTLGLIAHGFCYAALRGILRIRLLNLLQFANLGAVPILVIATSPYEGLGPLLARIGCINGLVAGVFLVLAWWPSGRELAGTASGSVAALYLFSLGRLPAILVAAALTATVPWIAKDRLPLAEVGYLSISITLLIGLGGLLSPLGAVMLPHLSAMAGRGGTAAIGRKVHVLIGAALHLYLFVAMQILVFADYALAMWLGEDFSAGAAVLRVSSLALVGFGFFAATRTVLDAVSPAPINAINAFIAFAVLFVLITLVPLLDAGPGTALYFAFAYAMSGAALGVATYRSLRRLFPENVGEDRRHLVWGAALCVALGAAAVALKPTLTSSLAYWLLFQAVSFAAYLLAIWRLKFEWLALLARRVAA